MALSLSEIEAITNDYFFAEDGRAVDIYFRTSFLLDYLMNQQKGIFERPAGGEKIRIPLKYSGAEGGFFDRADALSSDDRESINAAFFLWKYAYGNATIYLQDEMKNSGEEAEVSLVTEKIETAQQTCSDKLARSIYAAGGDKGKALTGLQSLTMGATDVEYGGIAEDDLVAADGTKPWTAININDAELISLDTLRTMRAKGKVRDGANGRPNVATMPQNIYDKINSILTIQQRFVSDKDTATAGFTHLVFEDMILAADDFCPAGQLYTLNTAFIGFAIHQKGFFARQPWVDLSGPAGRSMKILWSGNLVCSNRKAHVSHTNVSVN
mgnify:CR=1 FL=1